MKKLFKRVFGIAASAALLVTSSMTAFAADPGHNHNDGKPITTTPSPAYTITLTHSVEDTSFAGGAEYGAYQIFSGTVKGSTLNMSDSDNAKIPITDIKWGNAFGITKDMDSEDTNTVELTTRQKNIISFVYALAKAPSGSYSYAFSNFKEFENFFDGNNNLKSDYVEADSTVTVTVGDDGKVESISNPEKVNYDKLAVAVSDVLAQSAHIDDHEWLQAFTDILGGYAQGDTGYKNSVYVDRYYEGSINSDDNTKYQITVPAGYYMIRDLSSLGGTDKSYSARMLFVANNVEQKLKESIPTLKKNVVRDGKLRETEAAGVGDDVKFRLTGTLPDNYDLYLGGYQYTFIDTLSNGLDLVQYNDYADYGTDANNCVKVTVKGLFEWDETGKKWTWDRTASEVIPLEASDDKTDLGSTDNIHITDNNYSATYNDHKLTVEFPCLREIRISKDDAIYRLKSFWTTTQK